MPHPWRLAAMLSIAALVMSSPAAAQPPPGHPSPGQAREMLMPDRPSRPEELPHQGKVLSAIDANDFTYIDAPDTANYLLDGMKVKNTSSPSVPLVITGGFGRDATSGLVADIIDTFVYRVGLAGMQYSFATAVGLFKSLVGLVLMLTVNTISSRVARSDYGLFG